MKVAPALAASMAWAAEKHRVTLVRIPLSANARAARSPSHVRGSFTTTFGAMAASLSPSFTMVSKSVATASAEIGPSTRAQISAMTSAMLRPDLAISEGLVVTPSTMPVGTMSRMTATSAVSRKSFMRVSLAEQASR